MHGRKRYTELCVGSGYMIKRIFEKVTLIVGTMFFGGWVLLGTFFYIRAVIDFLI